MDWRTSQHLEENKYDLPGNWLKIEYFEALNVLFRFENALRVFVYVILKNELADKWAELSITSDDEEQSTIQAITRKRITQDRNYAYLGFILNSPLLHLTSGELIRIITSDSYWKYFKNYFLGSKDIIKNKLDEIGNVRNALAHFRPIKKDDIELVKQNCNHTLREIENTLKQLINCSDTVPSNTESEWYRGLITLGSKECKISFDQSKKEEWVRLVITYKCPVVKSAVYTSLSSHRVLDVKVPHLLNHYPTLRKHTIFVSEWTPHVHTKTPNELEVIKEIKFTLSQKTLSHNYKTLKSELEKLLLQISNEVELIEKDNLARGKLVEVTSCIGNKTEGGEYFYFDMATINNVTDEASPVEYWGTITYASKHFITDMERYPWMHVDISDDKAALLF